jgi:hypothetical protein
MHVRFAIAGIDGYNTVHLRFLPVLVLEVNCGEICWPYRYMTKAEPGQAMAFQVRIRILVVKLIDLKPTPRMCVVLRGYQLYRCRSHLLLLKII